MKTKYIDFMQDLIDRKYTFQQLKEVMEKEEDKREILRACLWVFTEFLPKESKKYKKLKESFFAFYRKDLFLLFGYLDKGKRIVVKKEKLDRFLDFQINMWNAHFFSISFRSFVKILNLCFETGYQEDSLRKELMERKDMTDKTSLTNRK